jgi:glycine betaine/proline transport system substrate-binding protein
MYKLLRFTPSSLFIFFFTLFFSITSFSGCSSDSSTKQATSNEDETIKLAYANWAEGVALTSLTAVILEDRLGYQVETKMSPVSEVFDLIASGQYDLFMDAWLPRTHAHYIDQYGAQLSDLGVVFEGAQTGLVVPSYMDISSISELSDMQNDISNQIIGIESTAGIMKASQNLSAEYDLSGLTLITTSGNAMTDSLQEAILRRDPIVITGWVPHWMWAEFSLKFLDDPKEVYGTDERIHAMGHQSFTKQFPRVQTLIQRMQLNRVQLADLMDQIRLSDAIPMKTARKWMQDNPQIVNEWVRGLSPEREKVM